MPNATVKIENVRFILTLDPERRIIRDGAIVVEGSRITQVGKAADLKDVPADRVIDGSEMVATPGFINGHLHISYAHATRGIFPDSLEPVDYLGNVFRLALQMRPEEEYNTSLLALTEALKYGTTTVVDPGTTRYPDSCIKAYEESGARVIIGASVTDLPNAINVPLVSLQDAEQLMESTVKQFDGALDGRVRAWTMPADVSSSSKELLQAAKRIADKNGTRMTIHCVNSPQAVEAFLSNYGRRPIEWLEDIGVLGPNLLLAHVVGLNDSEVDCVARTDTKMVMCPTAAVKMGAGTSSTGPLAGDDRKRRHCRPGHRLCEQLLCRRGFAVHVPRRGPIQGWPGLDQHGPCGKGPGNGHNRRGPGPGARVGHRLPGGRQEGRHRPVRHPPPGVAHPVQPRQQPGIQCRWQERAHGSRGRQDRGRGPEANLRGRVGVDPEGTGHRFGHALPH